MEDSSIDIYLHLWHYHFKKQVSWPLGSFLLWAHMVMVMQVAFSGLCLLISILILPDEMTSKNPYHTI